MRRVTILKVLFFTLTVALCTRQVAAQSSKSYLKLLVDTTTDEYAYRNSKGEIVIPFGKYNTCYTEKFITMAIVSGKNNQIVGIDRDESVLFEVFVYDNGPDYLSNGLFRIVKDGKIGYANFKGQIVIPPQFDCAYPFKNGKAKVGKGCRTQSSGEHQVWTGGEWFTIDKKGRIVDN